MFCDFTGYYICINAVEDARAAGCSYHNQPAIVSLM